jgi:hypothetical protein
VPGEALTYVIVMTNAGPSDAVGVQVTDTLPGGFNVSLVLCSSGRMRCIPVHTGDDPGGRRGAHHHRGQRGASVTTDLVNRVGVTSTTPGESDSVVLTTPVSPTADLALVLNSTPTTIAG